MEVTAQSNDAGSAGKKVYNVPDILPGPGFIIEIRERDGEQNPVRGVEFNYWVDNKEAKNGRTDENGMLKVMPGPNDKVKLVLP